MRFNLEADHIRGRGTPLVPMAVWVYWEEAGKGNEGLAEILQGMSVQ